MSVTWGKSTQYKGWLYSPDNTTLCVLRSTGDVPTQGWHIWRLSHPPKL